MSKIVFETVENNTGISVQRAEVPGGWLVMACSDVVHTGVSGKEGCLEAGYDWRPSITFVPDPTHQWLQASSVEAPVSRHKRIGVCSTCLREETGAVECYTCGETGKHWRAKC